ncbi:MAG TPA: mannose-1-phosphate guanyltransferase [Verrucomicrobiales bacterium]|jgi:mannose-1-phosphate guanylyltransferase|nr:mannose-1-phosphate guanyltransferase [Verrucomicrobiales bacterium]
MLKKKERFIVIMAGGRGERFWPVSRLQTPKQLISLVGQGSFLQQTVRRVSSLVPVENILIVTNTEQAAVVRKQLPEIPGGNIIGEPCGRDTAAAVALGAALVGQRSPSGVMAVLPADHVIPEMRRFQDVLRDTMTVAASGNHMVTIGIRPNEPATGYGYIKSGKSFQYSGAGAPLKSSFFQADQFVEKPDLKTARRYLRSSRYRWNAGMFIWSFDTICKGLQQHCPELGEACLRWSKSRSSSGLNRMLKAEYPSIKKISVDFALMEKAKNVLVVDGDFAWDDLGAWTALSRHLRPDKSGNCGQGEWIQVDSANNVIFDARTRSRTLTALVGIRDAVVVHTDDACLIANKEEAQKIKQLVSVLESSERFRGLI